MKYILLALLLFTVSAFAQEVKNTDTTPEFVWDHDQVADLDQPITFRLMIASNNNPNAWKIGKDNITTKTAELILAPGHWRVHCVAVAGGLVSDPSGIVEVKVWPKPPGNANRVAVQVSRDLKNWEDAAIAKIPWPSDSKMFVRATYSIGDKAKQFDAASYIQGPLLQEKIVIFPPLTSIFSVN